MRRSLISPGASRMLALLTPEPCVLPGGAEDAPVFQELQALGLAEVKWVSAGRYTARLTDEGRRWRPSVNN